MKTSTIAKILLDHREKSMSSFIQSGQLRDQLGTEGYAEALRRRWIVADEDLSCMVRVTNEMTKVAQIREAAQFAEPEEPEPVKEDHTNRLATQHATRPRTDEMFGTGQPMAGSSPTFKTASPVADKAKEEESFDALLDA